MRFRKTAALAALLVLVLTAAPARANIGTYCGGWAQASVDGVHLNACYERSAWWTIRGRGKAFYDGTRRLDYLTVSVQLQRSADGTSGWTTVKSNVCGWWDGDIANGAPGNICNTPIVNVDAGYLYRSRAQITVFYSSGGTSTTGFAYSGLTS